MPKMNPKIEKEGSSNYEAQKYELMKK